MNFKPFYACLVLLSFVTFAYSVYQSKEASSGQFKSVVKIKSAQLHSRHYKMICTGTILSESWVLSAARCVAPLEYDKLQGKVDPETVVLAGTLTFPSDEPSGQERRVKEVYVHPDAYDAEEFTKVHRACIFNDCISEDGTEESEGYLPWTLGTLMRDVVDIALLRLEKLLEFNEWVGPVGFQTQISTSVTSNCTFIGFGESQDHYHITHLNYIILDIGDEDYCRTVMPGNLEDIKRHHLCAVSRVPYENMCDGDSGGPVMCEGVVHGVASRKPKTDTPDWCGEEVNVPMYFTSTAAVQYWMNSTMNLTTRLPTTEQDAVTSGEWILSTSFIWILTSLFCCFL